jgi:hypothetical protein
MDEQGNRIGKIKPKQREGFLIPSLFEKYDINMQTVMLRYDKAYCYMDETREFSPDFELFMRIACDYGIIAVEDCWVNCRRRKDSLTHKKIDRWWVEHEETIEAVLKKIPELAVTHPKSVKRGRAKIAYYKARYYYNLGDKSRARDELRRVRCASLVYFFLYALSLLPVFFWNKMHSAVCK